MTKGDHLLSRRDALALGTATAIMPVAAKAKSAKAKSPAMVISTWDAGQAANEAAFAKMQSGGTPLDGVEAGARVPEADPENHSVGLGGYPDRDGHVTLDAVIMDDRGHCGAVAALEDIVHAVSVARRVMEKTPHVMLVGAGARQFALEQGFEPTNLLTPPAEKAWREWLETSKYAPIANIENQRGTSLDHDTLGILARNNAGDLAGACTTSGMAFKLRGRVGDSPISGSGLFVEKGVGAATATGVGEEMVRVAGCARVISSMRHGASPMQACREAVHHIAKLRGEAVRKFQVCFLALSAAGEVGAFALLPGFTYAVTDSSGKTDIRKAASLWDS